MKTPAKTLQKLICISRTEALNGSKELEKYFANGWRITKISGSSQNTETFCWILLEKSTVIGD